ncbi:TonB-dependent receptor [Phenylobacterium sp.]|jgi:iron complex outermembrane receptor protein|uniref:TonB-dependent receptor n=1 Tax=Phenylobacterium sp. TaxID=1871053 RepID=UPI0025D03085|nr:TonB-dependent receptor [Phenylobacterium sp.]MCA3740996.1 TonB-dependent receptor [Phenylobacterium sp.]
MSRNHRVLLTRSVFLAGVAFAALTSAAPPASAQRASNTGPEATTVDDLVVTARRREEAIQDAPIAITAFTQETIQEARIESLADLGRLTPGLVYTPLFGAQNQLPIIRGAAQTFGPLNVGVFLDGVYLSGKAGVDLELNDLERVEIVKGPQSALYGRNTFAGAINYITQRPSSGAYTGSAELTVGDNGLRKGMLSISGPLNDWLAFRLSGFARTFDGFYTSSIDGGRVDFVENSGASLVVEARPTDRLTATFRTTVSTEDSGQPASSVIRTNGAPGTPAGGSATQQRNLLYLGELPSIPEKGVTVNTRRTGFEPSDYGQRGDTLRTSLTLDYDFDYATLTSISSYSRRKTEYTFDGDNTICDRAGGCPNFGFPFAPAIPFGQSSFATSSSEDRFLDRSQELRLASNGDSRLQWLIGAFYYSNEVRVLAKSQAPLTQAAVNTNGVPRSRTEIDSIAVFGFLAYEFSDRLRGSVELRYEEEDQSYQQAPSRTGGTGASALVRNSKQSFDFTTPRVTLDYHLTENSLLYGIIARGAKAGGFNTNLNITTAQWTYQPEYSWNYEIGLKNTLLDGDLILNAALFYTDWTDQQVACQNPVTLGGTSTQRTYTCNVGKAEVRGLELDGVWQLTDTVTLSGNYAYTDATYSAFVDDSLAATLVLAGRPPIDFNGNHLPYVPEHKLVISPQYERELGNGVNFSVRADVAYQSKAYLRADNLQYFGEKTTLDLRVTLRGEDGWRIQAYADNVLDDDTPTAGVRFFDSVNYSVSSPLVTGADRRQIGVAIGYSF